MPGRDPDRRGAGERLGDEDGLPVLRELRQHEIVQHVWLGAVRAVGDCRGLVACWTTLDHRRGAGDRLQYEGRSRMRNSGPVGLLGLLVLAVGCPAGETADDDSADTPAFPESCDFTFAILTDTHLGGGVADHGETGWDDSGGDGGENAARLSDAVQQVNERADDIAFAVVLGDLTDSSERSEFEAASLELGGLEVPWLPLLGNHDTWPYAWSEAEQSWDESADPTGDALLAEIFAEDFERATSTWTRSWKDPTACP